MRWRFVDRITAFEPWQAIAGRKAVSLEEYYLLRPLGREGILPESLVLESCVELARWLVAASSGFARVAELAAIERFALHRQATPGEVLHVDGRVIAAADPQLSLDCRVAAEGGPVAAGRLEFAVVSADGRYPVGELEELWREIHGAT